MHLVIIILGVAFLIIVPTALFKYRPQGVLFCLFALSGIGLSLIARERSTFPSSARRITVVGHAVDWRHHQTRRRQWWTFVLMPSPDQRLLLRTGIGVPAKIAFDTDDTVRVTYLDETAVLSDPRAIRLDLLTGTFAGWSGSEDANWIGWWLGVPGGFVIAVCCFAIAQRWRRQARSEQNSTSQTESMQT